MIQLKKKNINNEYNGYHVTILFKLFVVFELYRSQPGLQPSLKYFIILGRYML